MLLDQVARYGRGFSNGALRAYGPLTVKAPEDLQTAENNNVLSRTATFTEDEAPVFDLQKMLEQQELKRRIEEANRLEAERRMREEMAERVAEEIANKMVDEMTDEADGQVRV